MEHLFVSYEIAMQLKGKGFDENCFAKYNLKKQIDFFERPQAFYCVNSKSSWFSPIFSSKKTIAKVCTAPTHQQVVDWFRDKHSILISVDNDGKEYFYVFTFLKNNDRHILEGFNSYYEAFNKSIKEALKLI